SSEMIFILSGEGQAITDGAAEKCTPGTCHYCPKGSTHTLINNGSEDLVFFAVVPQQ
ncbi:MAG: cupin domain-containing protein, partial [Clostridia bacterium]|nr:cupin domain-containing protein [Clostridia bacterium]MBR5902932.1 cupin domain-containing protein [Clostridia bacterium]